MSVRLQRLAFSFITLRQRLMKPNRWQAISPSSYPWEQEALNYLSQHLPDHEPFRGWSNFEFIADDGTINEVDALILGPAGFYLVEIKSRPGEISGDTHTWTWRQDGRPTTDDNPLFLANRKARKLASLLKRQKEFSRLRLPFIEAVIFCSAAGNRLKLPDSLAQRVFIRDQGNPPKGGIIEAVTQRRFSDNQFTIDAPLARAIGRALDQAGIRPANRARRVADYTLQKIIYEHPQGTFQDWLATHASLKDIQAMVRIYPRAQSQSAEQQALAARAAEREYLLLRPLEHTGILQVETHTTHESGPALVFRFSQNAQRLDHFMRERGVTLTFAQRLMLVRQLAETISFAHGHRVAHRQLSPQSVFVFEPKPGEYQLKIYNWQLGQRLQSTAASGSIFSPTLHADQLSDQAGAAFLAPEVLRDNDADGEAQDIFALGSMGYYIFSGQPPAATPLETAQRVMEQRGLQLSAVLDGASKALCDLIQQSTAPAVIDRTESVRDFLKQIDAVEEAYTQPESEQLVPPLEAKPGDRIAPDLVVKHRLGSGSTAVALQVEWSKDASVREVVIKIASRPDNSERIRSEYDVLQKLRHTRIVEAFELREFEGGLAGILLSNAGPKTLARHLRDEGLLALDFLERFGSDLLEAVAHLEQEGFPHRDLKPENIGIRKVKDGTEHLTLFDFSLSAVPADNIRCGTSAYIDPFLTDRKPPRWDSAAERYSAALTLYEMATGDLPKWGSDSSHPATLKNEILIEPERFDAGIRDELRVFFSRALLRDFRKRFDNAVDMLAAWHRVFRVTESQHPTTPQVASEDHAKLVATATLDTHLVFLGVSNRAINALDRAGMVSVRDFLIFPVFRLNRLRGIGKKTVRELANLHAELRPRFPDIKATSRSRTTEFSGEVSAAELEVTTIDLMAKQLLAGGGKGEGTAGREAIRAVLGLPSERFADPGFWPSQTEVARLLGVTRQRIGQTIVAGRERWRRNPSLTAVRASIVEFLGSQGGAATPRELAQALLAARGSALEEPQRSLTAMAVVRAAVETELARQEPQFVESRDHGRVILALSPELADYAFALGNVADKVAALDPLATPQRTLEQLHAVSLPASYSLPDGVTALADNRLLQLSVATSKTAAVSARGEIYPRGMEAKRVLQLAQGALFVSTDISIEELQRRVQARYPDAAPLPPRPELDQLLGDLGSRLTWVDTAAGGKGAYRPGVSGDTTSSTSTTYVARTSDREPTPDVASPAQQVSRDFENRLRHAYRDGAFLVLMVPLKAAGAAEARLRQRFDVEHRDFDNLFISSLKKIVSQAKASWDTVLRADGSPAGSRDWTRLQQLATKALPEALDGLAAPDRTVLLTHPGLLARYDQMQSLAYLAAGIGRSDSRIHGLWILLPCDDQNALPTLLHRPVPVTSSAQWARVPEVWITGPAQDVS
jgi:serine/threonine protein kinase